MKRAISLLCETTLSGFQQQKNATVNKKRISAFAELDQVYVSGIFRFFYTNNPESIHCIADQTDASQNNVPDYVENLAIQARATADALSYLGFTHPLENQRYKGKISFIDCNIRNMGKGNGVAFSAPQKSRLSNTSELSLAMAVRNDIEQFPSTWSIISHELFHLYQYGYTAFRGSWYLEAMTNWAEHIIRATNPNKIKYYLPQSKAELEEQIYRVSYNLLWHRLAYLSTAHTSKIVFPAQLLNRQYTDGAKVFKGDHLSGFLFVRTVLEKMQIKSNALSFEHGLDSNLWTEDQQNSPENWPIMLKVIQETMHEMGMNQTEEERGFLSIN